MANTNSVAGGSGSGTTRNQFATLALAATTETILQVSTDSGTAVNYYLTAPTGGTVYGAQAALDVNSNSSVIDRSAYIYGLPSGVSNDQFSSASWDARPFKVRVSGVGNAGANAGQTALVNLYQGSSATVATNKLIGTTGAALATAAGGAFNWMVEATLLWDPTSQILSGWYTGNIAFGTVSQFTTTTVISNVVTSVTAALLVFNATVKFGNAAASTATIREFLVDRL